MGICKGGTLSLKIGHFFFIDTTIVEPNSLVSDKQQQLAAF